MKNVAAKQAMKAGDTVPSPAPVDDEVGPRPVIAVRIAEAKREWHGATDTEYRAAESLAMKVRDHRARPRHTQQLTPGELLSTVLNPFSDEPLAEGALIALSLQLHALFHEHSGSSDRVELGLLDTILMLAQRAEIAAETSRRLRMATGGDQ